MEMLKEGEVVLCTVEKIVGTTVFVKIEGNGNGTIITAEIAPGRIRNLRDYVVPNKKIVCKILRVDREGHADLSLRRVTSKEKKQVTEMYEREKNLAATLKTILENPEETINKIKKTSSLSDFFENAKSNPELLIKFLSKPEAEKIEKILKEKKEKQIYVKRTFSLRSEASDGILKIKKILPEDTLYIAAGRFQIELKDNKGYKEANQKLNLMLEEIRKKAKQENCQFELIDKK